MKVTGKMRYRQSFFGKKLILQVEVAGTITENAGATVDVREARFWIDARTEHLLEVHDVKRKEHETA